MPRLLPRFPKHATNLFVRENLVFASCLLLVGSYLPYTFGHVAEASVLVGCRGAYFFPWARCAVGLIPEGLGVAGDHGVGRTQGFSYVIACHKL